jgi:uncharacterized membrane protein
MTQFSNDAIQEIRSICQQTAEKTVVRLRLMTKPTDHVKDRSKRYSFMALALITLLTGTIAILAGLPIWIVALAQIGTAILTFTGLTFWHYQREIGGDQQESLQSEAVQQFRGLSDRDEDRRLNVLLYLCENQKRLFFIVGEHVASIVPGKLWGTISEGFEKQAKSGDMDQAVVSTLKTVALLLEVSLPSLPIEQDASTQAVVQSLKTVCDPVFAEERQEHYDRVESHSMPDQIGSLTREVPSPYADLPDVEEHPFPRRAAI